MGTEWEKEKGGGYCRELERDKENLGGNSEVKGMGKEHGK